MHIFSIFLHERSDESVPTKYCSKEKKKGQENELVCSSLTLWDWGLTEKQNGLEANLIYYWHKEKINGT